jgi:hypothetical protein
MDANNPKARITRTKGKESRYSFCRMTRALGTKIELWPCDTKSTETCVLYLLVPSSETGIWKTSENMLDHTFLRLHEAPLGHPS